MTSINKNDYTNGYKHSSNLTEKRSTITIISKLNIQDWNLMTSFSNKCFRKKLVFSGVTKRDINVMIYSIQKRFQSLILKAA